MCGIAGIYNYHGGGGEYNEAILEAMLEAIFHRGPDGDGRYFEESLAIGMRRLSIIDLAGGQQPIYSEDGRKLVIFNGEIYNHLALRAGLEKQGHHFRTNCDTEVLIHLYEEYGEDFVLKLRGMFGFAIWDKDTRQLFLARDRLGIKPLYYTQVDGNLIFGSEIKAILQHPAIHPSLDLEALSHFLSLKYVPAPLTMFENIYALPPGFALRCSPEGIKKWAYWDLEFNHEDTPTLTEDEAVEQLEALLQDAIRIRLMSDVPFGAFLSGGVDSSTIVALMSQFLNESVKTFSVGYRGRGAEYSELPYARIVANHYETEHHEIYITPEDFIALTEKVVWHLDQPIADQAVLATYMVSKLASQHVKMVLTGEGGDELFAGYARYVGNRAAPFFDAIPEFIKSMALATSKRLRGMRRPKVALYALCQPDEISRLTNWFPLFNADMKHQLLLGKIKTELGDIRSNKIFAKHLSNVEATDSLSRMLYVDTKLWLPDDLLARGDKTTMAASIEGRVPLLDHKLVEFAASLPPNMKLRGLQRKYLLKQVSAKMLPDVIINRKKQGFPMPVALWFREEMRDYVRDVLSDHSIRSRGLFNPDFVNKLLDEHESEFADHATLIWGLLNVELWHRQFIDNPVTVNL